MSFLLVVCLNGCTKTEVQPTLPNPIQASDSTGQADLQQALDFLNRLDEFDDQNQVRQRIQRRLQSWLDQQPSDDTWQADPLALSVSGRFSGKMDPEWLGQQKFTDDDFLMLQEATWMRDVARAVTGKAVPPPDLELALDDSLPLEVRQVALLFDWVVRNLQLDTDVVDGDIHRFNSHLKLYAWESLLMGRGTAEEKARVFTLLARQLGHPVVMLGIDRSGVAEAWLPAMLFQEDLYLFDMRLGAPVPVAEGVGIATLKQVMEDPALLMQLAVGDQPYRVNQNDVDKIVALVDVTPEYLSRRMQLLEQALLREQKMVLTLPLTRIAERVASSPGISNVGFWRLSYETERIRQTLSTNPGAMTALMSAKSLFNYWTPIRPARLLHLRGQYTSPEDSDRFGAMKNYLAARRALPGDNIIERDLLAQLNESPQTQQLPNEQKVEIATTLARQLRELIGRNASHWLGLMKFDQGKYRVANNFQQPLAETPGTWQSNAAFNLGRAHECMATALNGDEADAHLQAATNAYRQLIGTPLERAAQLRLKRLSEPPVNDNTVAPSSEDDPTNEDNRTDESAEAAQEQTQEEQTQEEQTREEQDGEAQAESDQDPASDAADST